MKKLMGIEKVNDSWYMASTQVEFMLNIKLNDAPSGLLIYKDVGNNAEYESSLEYGYAMTHIFNDEDVEMIQYALDCHTDRIYAGSMFMLDYDKGTVTPVTFTKVFE